MPSETHLSPVATGEPSAPATGEWVDELLLAGPDSELALHFGAPLDRRALRALVVEREAELVAAGLAPGGSVALRLPPSLAFVTVLLAAWRLGTQVSLLDYRLTQHEVDQAVARLAPQLLVQPGKPATGALRALFDVDPAYLPNPAGAAAATPHTLIQLSSGSTGPSKIIGRTSADVISELDRYNAIAGIPQRGERAVVLGSMVHVLGLVGGLLHGLNAGVPMVVPPRLTIDGILKALADDSAPTTLIGVPSQAEILAAVAEPPALPGFRRMITGGELVRPELWRTLTEGYGITLGNMYGMTELGVIATDIEGAFRPELTPAPGIAVRVEGGEVLLSRERSPYIGLVDPTRWADGWLRTRDAGEVDPGTGRVTIRGRLDSQVSIGGLKVDLTEVEQTLADAPGVDAAVVLYDEGIRAYVSGVDTSAVDAWLRERLAAYKRPRAVHVLPALPRTSSGKLLRDRAALRSAAEQAANPT
ncbi:class I adenylate-forming enzyme family protein [Actinokineospora cianjurensis]|uniref:Acyl-CoA synthetase (AMP-forming)/AMP-acid ligase II n=1 Tax=Actinokineospora cianjurensis TaxID=585224 RepID=A0A421B0I4_9PSEU|nr:class I adenylate-forming enzyme family protein [Actinokineospora cianjurensis]RLK55595.1 acyl-CoA synthetase (AMP-forming)/AMP-acid ligase II [Actinokineospora cianjurensis]